VKLSVLSVLDAIKAFVTPLQSIAQTLLRMERHMSRRNELLEAQLREQGVYVPDPEQIAKLSEEDKRVEVMYGASKKPFAEE